MGASLATSAAGLSPIVGALMAGVLIAETEYRGEVEVMMAPFYGLGLGIFLITVGMAFVSAPARRQWELVFGALLGVMLLKALVTALLLRVGGARKAVAAETSVVMASPSETTLIVLGAAAAAGVIGAAAAGFWQTVTALGLTLTPLLAWLGRWFARSVDREGARDAEGLQPSPDRPRAVIIGYGRVGRLVAEMLAQHDRDFVAVDSDVDCVKAARAEGVPVLFGDASRSDFLDRLNLGHASALILTMDDPVQNVRLVKKVRGWCPDLTSSPGPGRRARRRALQGRRQRRGAETLESSLQCPKRCWSIRHVDGPVRLDPRETRRARQQIMELGQLSEEPPQRGRR